MRRSIFLLITAVFILSLSYLLPSCDKLVTERIEKKVYQYPVAEFSAQPTTGCTPLEVQFTDLSNGPYDSLIWVFGDGDSLAGRRFLHDTIPNDSIVNPTHIYDTAGIYNVKLTIIYTPDTVSDEEYKLHLVIAGATVGNFAASPDSGCQGTEISFTPLDFGGVSSWEWNFGDGNTSTDSNPTHVYTSSGYYTVTLEVTGECGTKQIVHDSLIHITNCPQVYFYADTTEGCQPLEVTFHDTSYLDTEGYVSRLWDFGNGDTSTLPEPVVTYTTPGSYTVSLTVTSTGGTQTDSIENYITVFDSARALVSALSATSDCYSPLFQFQVKFRADSLGSVDSLIWYFGDGTQSPAALDTTPVHAYTTPGIYTVSVVSYGKCGDTSADTAFDFVVLGDILNADSVGFRVSPDSAVPFTTFTFTDTTIGVVSSRQWIFGTDTISDSAVVHHSFSDTGWHPVILTVGNPCGEVTVTDSVRVYGQ